MHEHNHKTETSNDTFLYTINFMGHGKSDEVATDKVLWVTVDNNLSLTNHVNELTKSIYQKLDQLSNIKHFLNVHARKQFFHAHTQSTIDYASTLVPIH